MNYIVQTRPVDSDPHAETKAERLAAPCSLTLRRSVAHDVLRVDAVQRLALLQAVGQLIATALRGSYTMEHRATDRTAHVLVLVSWPEKHIAVLAEYNLHVALPHEAHEAFESASAPTTLRSLTLPC